MMSLLFLIIATYTAAVLQTTVAPLMDVRGATPDFFAMVAIIWLLIGGGPRGFVAAALVGLAYDLTAAGPLGIALGVYASAGIVLSWLKDRLDAQHLAIQLLVIAIATILIVGSEATIARISGQTNLTWSTLAVRSVIVGVYTAGVSLPVLMVVGWFRDARLAALRTN